MNVKKIISTITALYISFVALSIADAAEYRQMSENTIRVETDSVPRDASSSTFTGNVKHLSLFGLTDNTTYTGSYVIFSPGARSYWHIHHGGQRLIVVKGTAWTQVWNGPKTIAKEGDTIWCPPNVKHWHGASPNEEMVQLTLTEVRDGKNVTWLEPVTDEQYYSN